MKKIETLSDFIERLEKSLSIEDYLSEFTEIDDQRVRCPFHYDEGHSMHLTPGSNMFECYECGVWGIHLINLIMLWEKKSFYEVLVELSEKIKIEIPENIKNEMTFFINRQKYE